MSSTTASPHLAFVLNGTRLPIFCFKSKFSRSSGLSAGHDFHHFVARFMQPNDFKTVLQDWGKYLGNATMTRTILDRWMHRCTVLEFEGKRYRLKEAAARRVSQADAS
jgi:hypothetical protein